MEWLRISNLSVTKSEIDSYLKTDFAASKDVIEEGFFLFDVNIVDIYIWSILRCKSELVTLSKLAVFNLGSLNFFVISVLIKFEKREL